MDSFLKCVFIRAGKHMSVHDVHPHSNDGSHFYKVSLFCVHFKFIMQVICYVFNRLNAILIK